MSFSLKVKEEIAGYGKTQRHCALAELFALMEGMADVEKNYIKFQTENYKIGLRIFMLIEMAFRFKPEIKIRKYGKITNYEIYIIKKRILVMNLCVENAKKNLGKNNSCTRAFLRGSFLASGSISNPEKTYHMEFVTKNTDRAHQILDAMAEFEIDAKIIRRKKVDVVYLKESNQIVRLLNVMSAHMALMELENLRIVKEIRNNVNRQVNCEVFNLSKTIYASSTQVDAINYIEDTVGLDYLSDDLKEVAILRRDNREASLAALVVLLHKKISKSGLNHRLHRILEIAEDIREKREEIR